jgi:Spy/CpxP family protein refolding chaperone
MQRSIFLALQTLGLTLAAQAPTDAPLPPPPGMACHGQPGDRGPDQARGGQGPLRPPQGPPQGMALLRFLDLTADQRQKVKAVLDQHRPAHLALHKALEEKAGALSDGLENPALSEVQLKALQAAESEARLQEVLEQRAEFLAVRALLSPEQQAKAERLRLKRAKEREAHRELMDELDDAGRPGPAW